MNSLVSLQLEFERNLLEVAPWTSGTLLRLIAGWRLNGGVDFPGRVVQLFE